MAKPEDLAWVAGFFNGEGTTTFAYRKKNYVYPRFTASQTGDPECLNKMRDVLGFGVVRGPYRPPSMKAHWKSYWYYHADGFEKTQAAIAMLWPWLSRVKKDQAKAVLEECRGS